MNRSRLEDEAALLRASDAERSETAELLRRHHAEGRLDTEELEERLERCYAAKTRGELDALAADLPGPRRRQREQRGRPRLPAAFLAIAAIVAVSVTTGAHVLWLIWPLAFFVVGPFGRRRHWRRVT
jgi:Flp pilus assembly protein TadB